MTKGGRDPPGLPSSIPDVSEPISPPDRPMAESDRRIRRSWWIFAVSFFTLGSIVVIRVVTSLARPIDWAILALVLIVGVAAIRHRDAVAALEVGRREEAEAFARILFSLSRSVSPDAIVAAIVGELGEATGADHIVVARRRPDARVLEATLVSARPGVPDSTTILPIGDLEDPVTEDDPRLARKPIAIPIAAAVAEPVGVLVSLPVATTTVRRWLDDVVSRVMAATPLARAPALEPVTGLAPGDGQAIADRIARRAGQVYGLTNTLAAPLTSEDGVVGAIVLSHRTVGIWSATTRRLLGGAAVEASSALARAYSQRAAEERASTDALTGLPNRRYFDEFCGLLARRRRSGDAVGVLMIDIDKFKVLNDTHGHATGDEVLRAVAGAIVAALREDDVPARYGGEEFVVLLRNPSPEVALDVGERVRTAVRQLDLGRFGVRVVTVSVGVAVAHEADQPITELVEQADRALYRAKRAGRDRVVAA